MDYIRKNGMIDINDALEKGLIVYNEPEVHGARKNKFWFNNYTWMYKEVDNDYNTYEEYAEIICYELSKLLNIKSAEYDLATYNGKKGVITKSVTKDNEKLIHGTELLNEVYEDYFVLKQTLNRNFKHLLNQFKINDYDDIKKLPNHEQEKIHKMLIQFYNQSCVSPDDFIYDHKAIELETLFEYYKDLDETYPDNFVDMKNGIITSNNLYDIWSAVEIYCKMSGYTVDTESFMKNLTDMFVFDLITNQGDRHADNWGVVIDKDTNTIRLATLYDNSGAFALNREKAIVNIDDFAKRLKIEKRPGKTKGIYNKMKQTIEHSFSGLKIYAEDVLERKRNTELIKSYLFQSSPEFIERLEEVLNLITEENLDMIFLEIENKTQEPVPDIVKNVTRQILMFNKDKINDMIIEKKGGEKR